MVKGQNEQIDKYFSLDDHSFYYERVGYEKQKKFIFHSEMNLTYQIQSFNCKIKINIDDKEIETISVKDISFIQRSIENNINQSVSIIGLPDWESEYDNDCNLFINSYNNDTKRIKIPENGRRRYIMYEYLNEITFEYDLKNFGKGDFFAFSLLQEEATDFQIICKAKNSNKPLANIIMSIPNTILLTYNDINKDSSSNQENLNTTLSIEIYRNNETKEYNKIDISIYTKEYKPIEILKNYITTDFSTNKVQKKYYYFNFTGKEEGEIMLNNKRMNGELYAYVFDEKKNVNLNDITNYPTNSENIFKMNQHTKRLYFNSNKSDIDNSTYNLLITYHYNDSDYSSNETIGFEFSLLVRVWEKYKSSPQIINIPTGENIYGYFEEECINHHYYSTFIPQDINRIIIQIKGNYIDAFWGKGKQKLYTLRKLNGITNLNVQSDDFYEEIDTTDLNNSYISFAFRPKNFFNDNSAYYYFRIIKFNSVDNKDSENNIIYQLDTNQVNICKPKYIEKDNIYACYFLLKNFYNEFNLYHIITSTDYNRRYYINESIFEKSELLDISIKSLNNEIKKFSHTKQDKTNLKSVAKYNNTSAYIIYMVYLETEEIFNVVSKFFENREINYHPIYSTELYQINNKNDKKTFEFNLKDNYFININWINGEGSITFINKINIANTTNITNIMDITDITKPENISIECNKNSRGKTLSFPIGNQIIQVENANNFIFSMTLNYFVFRENIEIFIGKTINKVFENEPLDLQLYLGEITEDIDINFKIINIDKSKTKVDIKGEILNDEEFKKFIKKEQYEGGEMIDGKFDELLDIGFLNVSSGHKNLVITLRDSVPPPEDSKSTNKREKFFSGVVEILALKKKKINSIPVNTYILGSFNLSEVNEENVLTKYHIINDYTFENRYDNLTLLFDSNCINLLLNLSYSNNNYNSFVFNGDNKFFEFSPKNYDINITINSIIDKNNAQICNYMLRYFYITEKYQDYTVSFDSKNLVIEKQNKESNWENVKFTFRNIEIFKNHTKIDFTNNDENIYLYIKLFDKDEVSESLNTLAFTSTKSFQKDMIELDNNTDYERYYDLSKSKRDFLIQIKIFGNKKDFMNNLYFSTVIEQKISDLYLDEIKEDSEDIDNKYILYIVLGLSIFIILLIIIISIVLYYLRKIKLKNIQLENKISDLELTDSDSENGSKDVII